MEEIHPLLCFIAHTGSLYVLYVPGLQVCPLFSRRTREAESGQRTVETGQASRPGLVFNGEPLYGAGPSVSAQFVKMGSKLCQIGNKMRMLTTATAEALKVFRDALSLSNLLEGYALGPGRALVHRQTGSCSSGRGSINLHQSPRRKVSNPCCIRIRSCGSLMRR